MCTRARASVTRAMRVLGNAPRFALKAYLCRLMNTTRGLTRREEEEGRGSLSLKVFGSGRLTLTFPCTGHATWRTRRRRSKIYEEQGALRLISISFNPDVSVSATHALASNPLIDRRVRFIIGKMI